MDDLSKMTPPEADALMVETWGKLQPIYMEITYLAKSIEEMDKAGVDRRYGHSRADQTEKLEAAHAKRKPLDELCQAIDEERRERGGWSRHWHVVSSPDGHVHSTMGCQTCNYATRFVLVPELSGTTGDEAIDSFGDRMCTVCFPAAPTHPRFIESAEERARREAEKAASLCPGSGQAWAPFDDSKERRAFGSYRRCPACRKCISTRHGRLYRVPKHKPPGPTATGLTEA
jgi:hypothetical protein